VCVCVCAWGEVAVRIPVKSKDKMCYIWGRGILKENTSKKDKEKNVMHMVCFFQCLYAYNGDQNETYLEKIKVLKITYHHRES